MNDMASKRSLERPEWIATEEGELVARIDAEGKLTGDGWAWHQGAWRTPVEVAAMLAEIAAGSIERTGIVELPPVQSAVVLPFRKPPELFMEPHPERIRSVIILDGEVRVLASLIVGVCLRTHDNSGLRIVPTKEVMFAIGDDKEPLRTIFTVGPGSAEVIRRRLSEFIAACEEEGVNESKDKIEEGKGG